MHAHSSKDVLQFDSPIDAQAIQLFLQLGHGILDLSPAIKKRTITRTTDDVLMHVAHAALALTPQSAKFLLLGRKIVSKFHDNVGGFS